MNSSHSICDVSLNSSQTPTSAVAAAANEAADSPHQNREIPSGEKLPKLAKLSIKRNTSENNPLSECQTAKVSARMTYIELAPLPSPPCSPPLLLESSPVSTKKVHFHPIVGISLVEEHVSCSADESDSAVSMPSETSSPASSWSEAETSMDSHLSSGFSKIEKTSSNSTDVKELLYGIAIVIEDGTRVGEVIVHE